MVLNKLNQVLGLERQNAEEIQEKLEAAIAANAELTKEITNLKEAGEINEEKAQKLDAVSARLDERLTELQGINNTIVTDSLAKAIDEAPGETPAAITADKALGTAELTDEATVEAVAEEIAKNVELITEEIEDEGVEPS